MREATRNFHESANALTTCLQTRDSTRKTDQCMLEAAKNMLSELLEETNDDLDRALQPQEDQQPLGTEAAVLVPRHRAKVIIFLRRQRLKIHCSHSETEVEVIRSCSETISPSREPLEYVASVDYHMQLVPSVSTYSNEG